jgi:hypothetical protein
MINPVAPFFEFLATLWWDGLPGIFTSFVYFVWAIFIITIIYTIFWRTH